MTDLALRERAALDVLNRVRRGNVGLYLGCTVPL
jgi:hypothetical protein